MYNKKIPSKTLLNWNKSVEGRTIEQKIREMIADKTPITDGVQSIFTERKKGVQPEFNIRTDRFDLAIDAQDKASTDMLAKRQERMKSIGEQAMEGMKKEGGETPANTSDNK